MIVCAECDGLGGTHAYHCSQYGRPDERTEPPTVVGWSVINGIPGSGEYVYLDRWSDGSVTWRPYLRIKSETGNDMV